MKHRWSGLTTVKYELSESVRLYLDVCFDASYDLAENESDLEYEVTSVMMDIVSNTKVIYNIPISVEEFRMIDGPIHDCIVNHISSWKR